MSTASRARPRGGVHRREAPRRLPGAENVPGRVLWVDTGRGIAIFLVVMYHSAQWLSAPGFHTETWRSVNDVLATLRMPLFFTISGMFAGKWLITSWTALWSRKLALFVWVYFMWSFIATSSFLLGLQMKGQLGDPLHQYRSLPLVPFLPRFELWFIWALVLLYVGARLVKPLPVAVQLGVAAVVSALAFSTVDVGNVGWDGLLKYAFFFLLGIHGRGRLFALGRYKKIWTLVLVAIAWAVMAILGVVLDANQIIGFYFVTALLGVITGVSVSRVLSSVRAIPYLGARTLQVYLIHTSIILVLAWPLQYLPESVKSGVLPALLVPVLAAVVVLIALTLHRALADRPVTRFLYEPPAWFRAPNTLIRSLRARDTRDSA